MPYYSAKLRVTEAITTYFAHPELTAEKVQAELSTPPSLDLGHFAFPCFRLAKLMGVPAGKIVMEATQKLKVPGMTLSASGPYLNFKVNPRDLFHLVTEEITTQKSKYGADGSGNGLKVVLEYCSPNIAKRLGFQHIRSTLIGNILSNVYEFLGYSTERINFVGDWGSQFARLLAAFELWGKKEKLNKNDLSASMDHLLEIYVRFHKEMESQPELLGRASECLQRLEKNEPKTRELWSLVREISVLSMEKTLSRMQIRFHHVEGESHYTTEVDKTLEEIKKKADAKISEGAWIVEVPDVTVPALIQKRDGTTLYLTRDIAALIDRYERFHFHKSIYVVSEQQRLHFQQLFGVVTKMGYPYGKACEHVAFGTVLFGSEKMSTREGRVIFLDAILDEAKALALEECTKKNPELANKEEVAEIVGVGAVIFGNMSSHRTRDIQFDWKNVLAFDGETGPYVQYANVRSRSLLEKAGINKDTFQPPKLAESHPIALEEEALIVTLSRYRAMLKQIVSENDPYYLTSYLIDLAKAFNRFYYQFPVLQAADEASRDMRIALVVCTEEVIRNGLALLGIKCPKEM